MKLDSKQDLNVLYQVCVFRADRKNKMAAPASDWLRHFRLLLWPTEQNSMKLDRKQNLNVLYQVCVFLADHKNKMATQASDCLRHLNFSSETAEQNSTKLDRKQDLNVLYQVCFWPIGKQDDRPGLWLAETFFTSSLKLLKRFNETWQEVKSRHPLPSLWFLCWSKIKDGCPCPWLAKTVHFYSEIAEHN